MEFSLKQWLFETKWKISDFLNSIKWICKNIKSFYPTLKNFRPYDHEYCIDTYINSLNLLKKGIKNFKHQAAPIKDKKLKAIDQLIYLLENYDNLEDCPEFKSIFESKEKSLNEQYYEADMLYWYMIYRILRGQSKTEKSDKLTELRKQLKDPLFKKEFIDKYELNDSNKSEYNWYVRQEVCDGTGCASWVI